jgi:hypothetical protein
MGTHNRDGGGGEHFLEELGVLRFPFLIHATDQGNRPHFEIAARLPPGLQRKVLLQQPFERVQRVQTVGPGRQSQQPRGALAVHAVVARDLVQPQSFQVQDPFLKGLERILLAGRLGQKRRV